MIRVVVFVLCLISISLTAQDQIKADTLKKKTTSANTVSGADGGAIGRFFRGINNAAKSTAKTANQLNSSAESFQKSVTKFAQHVEAYAPDSMRTKTDTAKMKKSVTTVPVKPKTKSDSTKRKSVFEDVFKEN